MRKILRFIAKFIAAVCAILFVITALLAVPLSIAGFRLFSPELYKQALLEANMYERLPALAGEQIMHSMTYNPCDENPESEQCQAEREGRPGEEGPPGEGGPPAIFQNLKPKDYEVILSELAPPDWMQAQAESVIDQAFAYVDSDDADPAITISLVELKERLAGEEGMRAVMQLLRAQPPCTDEQMDALEGQEITPENVPICRPPQELIDQYTQDIEKVLDDVAADIEDEVSVDLSTLGEADLSSGEQGPFGDDPRAVLRTIRWGMRLSPLVPMALLLLVTLFGVRSWKGWLLWWGIPCLIVGLIWAGLALAAMPGLELLIRNVIAENVPGQLTANLFEAGMDVVRHVARTLALGVGIEGGVLAALGLLLIVPSFFIRRKPVPEDESSENGSETIQLETQ